MRVGAPWIDTKGGAIDGEHDDGELTGQGVRVYVVDDGVQGSHVDFGGRVVPGYTVKAAPVVAYTRHCPCHPPTTATPRDSPSIHPTHPVPTTTDHPLPSAVAPPRRPTSAPSAPRAKLSTAYILPADGTGCSGHGTHVASSAA